MTDTPAVTPPPDVATLIEQVGDCKLLAVGPPQRSLFLEARKKADTLLREAWTLGTDPAVLVHGRAALVDHLLHCAWHAFGFDPIPDIALVAVGGYGRGELHPHSDIDLMLLTGDSVGADTQTQLGAFTTFLWDIGLEVGHSLRSLKDCQEQCAADITVATNLMESRCLAGSAELHRQMVAQTGPDHIWNSRDFFTAKLAEQQARYHKFDDTAYKLEPNVKEGPGGLRDIQTVGWVAKRHLNVATLHDLVDHGFLTEDEHQALVEGQHFLWRVRTALHFVTKRREDRLLFDYQRTLATLLGYRDEDHNLAVEQFMQQYFRTAIQIQRLNEMLLQLYQEAILYAGVASTPTPINRRFQSCRGFLEVAHENVYRRHPSALLETFLLMQQHPELKGVRASTIRLIRRDRALINQAFRNNIVNRSLFMEILRQPTGITHELQRMNRYGVLAAYWPSFARIVGRMQYDLFHVYTVDEHTLTVLRNVRRFSVEKYAAELPLCHALFKQLPKVELLYLAALFHDIAKGRGGDHSNLGSDEAEQFCLEHGLSAYDAQWVAWLVKNHLVMSMTAQRKDLSDPKVIHRFAQAVGSVTRLDYLYLLTVADIRGTSPKLWNGWKDALLLELYHATRRVLRRGLETPFAREELLNEVKQTALKRLSTLGLTPSRCLALWEDFDEEYFISHSADEVTWQTQAILQADLSQLPLVVIRQYTERGCTEIFVYARSHNRLFAHITAALSQMGLNVLDARISTGRGQHMLDTFLVLDESGQAIESSWRISEINTQLRRLLNNPDQALATVARRVPRQLKHFEVKTEIEFFEDVDQRRTIMELVTHDHPGLLAKVAKVFLERELVVHKARIATIGAQVEDLFYITDYQRQPITDPAAQDAIREALRRNLGELSEMKPTPAVYNI